MLQSKIKHNKNILLIRLMRVEVDYPAVLVLHHGAVSWSGYDPRL